MKKTLLFAAAAFMLAGNTQAQTFRFVHNGDVLENNAQITIVDFDPTTMLMDWEPAIQGSGSFYIMADVEISKTAAGDNAGMLSLCETGDAGAGNCYNLPQGEIYSLEIPMRFDDGGNRYTGSYTMPDGGQGHFFHAGLMPFDNSAVVNATFTIVNADNEEDYTTVFVKYDYPAYLAAAVDKTHLNKSVKAVQQGENLMFNYAFDTLAERTILVSNLVGAHVASIDLEGNNGTAVVPNRLAKGVYVYTLVENGKNVKSYKIIIR